MALRRVVVLVVLVALSLGLSWALIDLTSADPPDPVPSIVLRDEEDPDEDPDPSPGGSDGGTPTRGRTQGAQTASPPPPPPAGGGVPAPIPAGDDTFDTRTDGSD